MSVSSKTLGVTAGVIVAAGGLYLGAQAVVGNEVETSLADAFDRLERSPSWHVSDVHIERHLFHTTARATLGMAGNDAAQAKLDLNVDHGVFKSPVTGTLTPAGTFLDGTLDIDMTASWRGIAGQLRAESLQTVEEGVDGALTNLVVDVDYADEHDWRIASLADDISITRWAQVPPFRLVSPRWEISSRGGSVAQRMSAPRLEIAFNGHEVTLEEIAFETVFEPSAGDGARSQDQNGRVSVAAIDIDGETRGSLSMTLATRRFDVEAFQAYQEHYARLVAARPNIEATPTSLDRARYGQDVEALVDSGYRFLANSPEIAIDPLEAHVVMPEYGLDFSPRLSAELRFDGQALSREALYALALTSDLVVGDALDVEVPMSGEQASQYLLQRLFFDVRLTTPPREVLEQLPLMVGLMIDPDRDEQTLIWDQGRLSINGEAVM